MYRFRHTAPHPRPWPAPDVAAPARGLRLALVTTAAVVALLATQPVGAQVTDRNAGWWSKAGTVREAPERQASDSDRAAAQLYAGARALLDAGQMAEGQRRLEVLVVQHPGSPLADVARGDLQRLYASRSATAVQAPAAAPAPLLPRPAPGPVIGAGTTGIVPAGPLAPATSRPSTLPDLRAHPAGLPAEQPLLPLNVRQATDDFRVTAGDRVFFADSSDDLGGRSKAALEAQAAWLNRYPGIEIVIEGHADDHGSADFNREMAERRARAVKVRLADLGVAADRIAIAAHGRDRPVADCAFPSCATQNRRVVISITRVPAGLGFDRTRVGAGLR